MFLRLGWLTPYPISVRKGWFSVRVFLLWDDHTFPHWWVLSIWIWEFKFFLLLDWLPIKAEELFALQYNWKGETRWIHTFSPSVFVCESECNEVSWNLNSSLWFLISFHAANPNPHIDVGPERIKLITLVNSPRWTWAIVLYGWRTLLPSELFFFFVCLFV